MFNHFNLDIPILGGTFTKTLCHKVTRCEIVDLICLMKRVGIDGNITQASTVQIDTVDNHNSHMPLIERCGNVGLPTPRHSNKGHLPLICMSYVCLGESKMHR